MFKIFLGGNVNAVERDFLYLQGAILSQFPTHSFKFTSEFFEDQCVHYFLLCFQIIAVNLFKFEKIFNNNKKWVYAAWNVIWNVLP